MIDIGNISDKKTLSGDAWIELDDETRLRIDYPTRAQETQQRLLRMRWESGKNSEGEPHWIGYYVQCTVKEVEGFRDEATGQMFQLELDHGLAMWLVCGKKRLNFLAVLTELGLAESLFGLIYKRLEMTELEKKSLNSPPHSSKRESSARGRKSSSPAKLPTDGNPSDVTAPGTLSSVTA